VTIRTTACEWDLDMTCCPAWDSASNELKQLATDVATEIMWNLSGRQFGLCTVTVRPCREPCTSAAGLEPLWGGGSYWPRMIDGAWINGCGECVTDCSCGPLCEVVLPGPVDSVVEVTLDGVVIDSTSYVVHNHRRLVRTNGECWPTCQHLDRPLTEEGTFGVTYRQGIPVPAGGRLAAGTYACELLKACQGLTCRLPKRVTSLTREGVMIGLIDPMDMLDQGRTGLYEVDAWLVAVNPNGLRHGARVYSPDRRPPRVQTWP
jgi:hypothetical protein